MTWTMIMPGVYAGTPTPQREDPMDIKAEQVGFDTVNFLVGDTRIPVAINFTATGEPITASQLAAAPART